MADNDDHQHTDCQNQHVGITGQQVLEIGGGDHFAVRGNVKEDNQCD